MENIDREWYSALRHGGASRGRACAELGVNSGRMDALEAMFLRRSRVGPEPVSPRFARHDRHVAAVMAAGGYPVLPR